MSQGPIKLAKSFGGVDGLGWSVITNVSNLGPLATKMQSFAQSFGRMLGGDAVVGGGKMEGLVGWQLKVEVTTFPREELRATPDVAVRLSSATGSGSFAP